MGYQGVTTLSNTAMMIGLLGVWTLASAFCIILGRLPVGELIARLGMRGSAILGPHKQREPITRGQKPAMCQSISFPEDPLWEFHTGFLLWAGRGCQPDGW